MRLNTALLLAAALMLVTGCRTYGGYGSEEATYNEIQEAAQRYADRVERLAGDYQALTEASAQDAELAAYALRMADIIEHAEATLAFHLHRAETLEEGDSYRELSRALGAMISEQQILEDRYADLVGDIVGQPELGRKDPSRYSVVSSRLARAEADLLDISIRDAVRAR